MPDAAGGPAPAYPLFKAAIFALLAANAIIYALAGTLSEALDTVAWFILLILFELETGSARRTWSPGVVRVIHAVRLIAAAIIGVALIAYIDDQSWLDVINVSVWIAVIVMLEYEVRHPQLVIRHRRRYTAAAAVLYTTLGVLVLMWAGRGEWFNAYDALLWLGAFVLIEMNVLGDVRSVTG
jgi:hypothetical protein